MVARPRIVSLSFSRATSISFGSCPGRFISKVNSSCVSWAIGSATGRLPEEHGPRSGMKHGGGMG